MILYIVTEVWMDLYASSSGSSSPKELLLDPESEDNTAWNDDSCLRADKAEAVVQKDLNLQHHSCDYLKF